MASEPRGQKPRPKKVQEPVTHWIDFASKEQKDAIHAEINMFGKGDGAWQAVIVKSDSNVLTYKKGDFWSVHLLPRDAKDRFKGLMGNPGLKHFGLFLGLLKQEGEGKHQFNLSLEGASELVRACAPMNWVRVNDAGEKSFLYGQDIKKEHVAGLVARGISHPRGICLVVNGDDACLGIGRLACDDPTIGSASPDDVVIKNVVDKGVYLRAQGTI